jgi:hypothetical protein
VSRWVLPLMAAAVFVLATFRGNMATKIPPQWGSSVLQPLPAPGAGTSPGTEKRLVHLRFDRAQDITVYLQGALMSDGGNYTAPATAQYRVSVGSGGVAIEQGNTLVPAVGVARHFVTDAVDVEVRLSAFAGASRMLAATAAFGRPVVSYRIADMIAQNLTAQLPGPNAWSVPPTLNGWTGVNDTTYTWFRVPTYATRARMQVAALSGGATAANFTVTELDWSADFYPIQQPNPSPTGPTGRTAQDFADWQFIAPQATYLRVRCGTAGGSGKLLVEFERVL